MTEKDKKNKKIEKVVLMYSGGLDTSISIKLLQEKYGVDVIACTVDVGQPDDFKQLENKALKLGAKKAVTVDAKKEFVEKFIFKALKANALYCDFYPVSTSIARPIITLKAIELANKEKADAIAHGCKGRGADYFRFMIFLKFFAPDMKILTPIGDWCPTREEEVEYAYEHKIPVPISKENPFSYDESLWGNAINYGSIDNITLEVPESAFTWTVKPEKAVDKPEYITIEFKNGIPVKLNGIKKDPVKLIKELNEKGGKHGIGRVDMIEEGIYGNKFKWVYEVPAATILLTAHKDLEKIVLPKETLIFKDLVDNKWAKLAYDGYWFNPLIKSLEAFVETTQQFVNGEVKLKLFKGNVTITTRKSKNSLLTPTEIKETIKVPYGWEDNLFVNVNPKVISNFLK